MTSLAIACYESEMTVAKRLLTIAPSTFNVNMVTGKRCNTALHEVIWYTQDDSSSQVMYRGDTAAVVDVVYESDVNMQDRDGMDCDALRLYEWTFRHSESSVVSIC
jgi:hypothetical protein